MAWNRYRLAAQRIDQENRNDKRVGDIRNRLEFYQKKRTYGAMKDFVRKHRMAKRWMKTLVHGLDKHNKENVFRRWKDFNHTCQMGVLEE